jgi:EAL domain-containing protein (putative c-di-GMP-specific phosphodiesterase class I)
MHTKAVAQLELEADLQRAVERQEFELFYQPIVALESGQVTRVEALLRWRHPQRGLVLPSEFIALAEETGLIVPLGAWCLRTACHQALRWRLFDANKIRVSVNLSARQFQDQNLPELTRRVLDETGLPAQALELEITERTAMHDIEHTIRVLNELHCMGIHISIDDFGESYSALGYLKRFPIDTLKIDRSFITDVVTNPDAAAIASALIAMAHQLALRVVAEGVENEFQAAFLRSVDCDEVQGFIVAHPVPATQLPEFTTHVFLREMPLRLTVNVK